MPSDLVIRPYQPIDQDYVVRLWERVFPDEPAHNKPEEIIVRKLRVQPGLFYVALLDGHVVGTVIAGDDGVRGWVHKLAVDPDCRRKGIASKLMRQAEQGLAELGCPKLNLQVRTSNHCVLEFYRGLGYAVEDRVSLGKPLS